MMAYNLKNNGVIFQTTEQLSCFLHLLCTNLQVMVHICNNNIPPSSLHSYLFLSMSLLFLTSFLNQNTTEVCQMLLYSFLKNPLHNCKIHLSTITWTTWMTHTFFNALSLSQNFQNFSFSVFTKTHSSETSWQGISWNFQMLHKLYTSLHSLRSQEMLISFTYQFSQRLFSQKLFLSQCTM